MIDFLNYLAQVSIAFACLYLLYRLLFSRLTFHGLNRGFLLAIMPLSLLIPHFEVGMPAQFIAQTPLLLNEFGETGEAAPLPDAPSGFAWQTDQVIGWLYALGVAAYLLRLAGHSYNLLKLRRQSAGYDEDGFHIRWADVPLVFSCFRWIFIPTNMKGEVHPSIIAHEKRHGEARHTFDLIFAELFAAFAWFNPFVYLLLKDLKTVHEYQVDASILEGTMKKSEYLQVMLDNLMDTHRSVSLGNYFSEIKIKKRVDMIAKRKSSTWKLTSYAFILPLAALLTMSFSGTGTGGANVPSISPIKKSDGARLTSGFGMRMHPYKKVKMMHKGIDLAAALGTNIYATADGIVTTVKYKKESYGRMVSIDHGGGYMTVYSQMDEYIVEKGERVKQGEIIGYVGSSGVSTGPHLHYEVHKDGKPVDPKGYMD